MLTQSALRAKCFPRRRRGQDRSNVKNKSNLKSMLNSKESVPRQSRGQVKSNIKSNTRHPKEKAYKEKRVRSDPNEAHETCVI